MDTLKAKELVASGKAILGIELGSTRIKSVLIGSDNHPVAQGSYTWENQLVDGLWTYGIDEIWSGLQASYADLCSDVRSRYGVELERLAGIGISAMMHGYMPFGKDGNILVPFRTWRNTNTGRAARELSELFDFNIPLRWSISHLYQAILDGEEHVGRIDFLTTLAGYIHWQLSGRRVLGIGDASGMLPVDSGAGDYSEEMIGKFDDLVSSKGFPWKLRDILPKALMAGEDAGYLTEAGAMKLDPSGRLKAGVPMCPPEGDAGTGMVATNAVRKRTGNVSAGTSSFSMIVLEKPLSRPYEVIDMVTTPDGSPVAMVHCNNCTSDINAWVELFAQFAAAMGMDADKSKIFPVLFNLALEGDTDCGGLLSYNYYSGEHITGLDEGRPPLSAPSRQQIRPAQLHADAPAVCAGIPEDWSGHSDRRGAGDHRQALWPRQLLQDPRCGSADAVCGCGRTGVRHGDRRRRRPLRQWRCWQPTVCGSPKASRWRTIWTRSSPPPNPPPSWPRKRT